jgi:hypothetical protein
MGVVMRRIESRMKFWESYMDQHYRGDVVRARTRRSHEAVCSHCKKTFQYTTSISVLCLDCRGVPEIVLRYRVPKGTGRPQGRVPRVQVQYTESGAPARIEGV